MSPERTSVIRQPRQAICQNQPLPFRFNCVVPACIGLRCPSTVSSAASIRHGRLDRQNPPRRPL